MDKRLAMFAFISGLLLTLTCSCANHFKVVAVTTHAQPLSDGKGFSQPELGNKDVGFQYAIPAPYLVITNAKLSVPGAPSPPDSGGKPNTTGKPSGAGADTKGLDETKDQNPSPPPVTATIIYLPSDEKYAVKVKSGIFGTFKGSLTLQNGWMLTGVNQEYDTKGTETVTAFSGVLGTILKAGGLGFVPEGKAQAPFLCLYKINVTGASVSLQAVSGDGIDARSCQNLLGRPPAP
ncbi:MAG TPA: hypothetical protein VKX25_13120 [Bryobacteraceae bacterium]|jgi:hypothetical protein|nr:hypothetical protein [Bryobacteraceae bacterium]